MTFFRSYFKQSFAKRLRRPGVWLVMALCAVLTVLLALPGRESEQLVRVGLVLPREGGTEFARLLEARCSEPVTLVPAEAEEVDRMLLSGAWDCALVLSEDFDSRVRALECDEIITLKTGPGSAVYPLVRETAAACLMELMTPHIARGYMEETGMNTAGLDAALTMDAPRVEVQVQTQQGEPLALPRLYHNALGRIARNLVAVLLLLWGICLGAELGRWLRSGAARRLLALRSPGELVLPQLCAGMALPFFWAVATLPVLGGGWETAVAQVGFTAATVGLGTIIARMRRLWKAVPVLLPFVLVSCLVLEPVLVEAPVKLPTPLSLFCRGGMGNAALLLGEGTVLLGLALADKRSLFSVKMRRGD